jgi:hypothetical protein
MRIEAFQQSGVSVGVTGRSPKPSNIQSFFRSAGGVTRAWRWPRFSPKK